MGSALSWFYEIIKLSKNSERTETMPGSARKPSTITTNFNAMKTQAYRLTHRWDTEKTTPMIRWIGGLAFWVNLPLSLMLIPGFMFLPLTFPGLILLWAYFKIWRDKVDLDFVKRTAVGTTLFNLALAFGFLAFLQAWPVAIVNLLVAAVSGIVNTMVKDAMYERKKAAKPPVGLPESLKDDYRTERVPLEDWRIPAPKQVA